MFLNNGLTLKLFQRQFSILKIPVDQILAVALCARVLQNGVQLHQLVDWTDLLFDEFVFQKVHQLKGKKLIVFYFGGGLVFVIATSPKCVCLPYVNIIAGLLSHLVNSHDFIGDVVFKLNWVGHCFQRWHPVRLSRHLKAKKTNGSIKDWCP